MTLKLKVLSTVNNKPFKEYFIRQKNKWLYCEDPKYKLKEEMEKCTLLHELVYTA